MILADPVRGIIGLEDRHPSVQHFGPLFGWDHFPTRIQYVSAPFAYLGVDIISRSTDNPELSAALRKLLEAKDCAVRAVLMSGTE